MYQNLRYKLNKSNSKQNEGEKNEKDKGNKEKK
jgi:hypothetical protein